MGTWRIAREKIPWYSTHDKLLATLVQASHHLLDCSCLAAQLTTQVSTWLLCTVLRYEVLSASTIQTPNFTDLAPGRQHHAPQPGRQDMTGASSPGYMRT